MLQHQKKSHHFALFLLICLFIGIGIGKTVTAESADPLLLRQFHPAEAHDALAAVPCTDGMADEYPCENVDLIAFMPFTDMGITTTTGIRSADIWGWTDPQTGDEYALLGMTIGTSFIRITDPENPVALGLLPTHTEASNWRDVKVYKDHAFIVSEADFHGMQVFDLTQLRDITTTTSISPTTLFTHTIHYDAFGSAHNIVINEESGFAYAVGARTITTQTTTITTSENTTTTITTTPTVCAGGLHFINIADPANPANSGCFSADEYTHDAQCVIYSGPDPDYQGKEICFASNEDTLTIVDVTDKSTPIQISRTGYENAQYTHQGWLTTDQAYFLLNDELDEQRTGVTTETYFWDVSDLDAPFIDNIYAAAVNSIDHNLYTRNDSAYLSNYTSGLRILGISDPTAPIEIGYFDVHPADDNPNFQGTWSNYPYFESGNVIISSIERGLFIVRPEAYKITAPDLVISCDDTPVTADIRLHAFLDATAPLTLSANDATVAAFGTTTMLPGTTESVTFTSAASEDIDIIIQGVEGTNTAETTITLVQSAPNAAVPLSPGSNTVNTSESMMFSWSQIRTASSYQIEISDDPQFSNIVYDSTVAGTSHTATNLPENQLLYWRVTAINECGSTVSEAQSFAALPTINVCTTIFEEDFETDVEGWDTLALTPTSTDTWVRGADGARTGSAGWSVDDLALSGQSLTSPVITLTTGLSESVDTITLRLWQKRNLSALDDVALLTFGAGGAIVPIADSLFSETFSTGSPFWNSGTNAIEGWSGTQDWTELTADFTPFEGGAVRLNFLLLPGESASAVQPAWALDDILIEGCKDVPQPADFNSGPLSYGLAWHGGAGEQRLGTNWDSESTPATGSAPTATDTNIKELVINESNEVIVDVTQSGWVRGWFDWNGDGLFTADELAIDQAVITATNTITVTPSLDSIEADIAYRIRVSTDSTAPAWGATGFVPNGEVEDGYVNATLLPTAITAVTMNNTVNVTSPPFFLLLAAILTAMTFIIPRFR